ncbi:chromo domain-like protein [Diplodia corticola]|uniref:Chromo domain-like protein n=1 Tax=Diplodia corticola TaxID=236234 RepID=A0A1J9R1P6_9PEZI|nr:chromo domain-like protein [Diplodia corticola]OJD34170.1 chromo domain-like protein [Diplodia corticola]
MAKLAPSRGDTTAAPSSIASRVAKRTRSASAPTDRPSRAARPESAPSTAPPKAAKTKVTKRAKAKGKKNELAAAAAAKSGLFTARAIVDEDAMRGYLIDWEGIDPATGKAYAPTWEPRSYANAALKREWLEKRKAREEGGEDGAGGVEGVRGGKGRRREGEEGGRAGREKTVADGSRKEGAPKRTASGNLLSMRERKSGTRDAAQNIGAKDGGKPDKSTAPDRKIELDAADESQHDESHEPLSLSTSPSTSPSPSPDRKRKREDDPVDVQSGSETRAAGPRPHKKKQRSQAANHEPAKLEPEPQDEGIFPARAITGEKPRYYRVAWEKDPKTGKEFEDTWEPKSYVSRDLVAEWKQQKAGQPQKAPKKQQRRPAKKAHEDKQAEKEQEDDVYSAKAIVGERHRHFLVSWEKDAKTGEDFEDTWEPKSNVSEDLVAEWRQSKEIAPSEKPVAEEQEQPLAKPREEPESVDASEQIEPQAEQGEQQERSSSMPLPAEPVTPRRDEDEEEEEDDEASYPPSSTMKTNTVPPVAAADTPTTDMLGSEEEGVASTTKS